MPLSIDQLDKLGLYANILGDRSHAIELALEREDRDAPLDEIADLCVEILEAAQAAELICARAARRSARQTKGAA